MNFHRKPTTFVGHVKIKVTNLVNSLDFYQEVIGFDILEQTKTAAKLTADGKKSILSLVELENGIAKQERTTGLYHFALLLPTRSDLAKIVNHLNEKEIRFGSSDHLVSEALYLNDPDGNQIEIYRDREPSEWTWSGEEVAMTVDPLDFEGLSKEVEQGVVWQGLPEKTVMGHIHLHVVDLTKVEEFYVKGLGFDIVNRFRSRALFLSTDKYHHHIAVNNWNGFGAPRPAENSAGLESFTLILPDEKAIKDTVINLGKIGVSVTEEDGKYITADPSGNRIELTI